MKSETITLIEAVTWWPNEFSDSMEELFEWNAFLEALLKERDLKLFKLVIGEFYFIIVRVGHF